MADGLSQLRASIHDWRRLGKHAALPQALAWLAEALVLNGEPRDALAAAEQGLDAVRQTGVRCCDAELYRLRGEAIRACGTPGTTIDEGSHDVAEASFWAGITVARQQGAPTLELRVAISLARFLLDSGREGEARQILGATSEVLEASGPTPDLTAARALLRR